MSGSKFIKRLRESSNGAVPGIGFKAVPAAPPPSLLLAVVVPDKEARQESAAIDGGAEAIIVRLSSQDGAEWQEARMREVLADSKGKPCGIISDGGERLRLDPGQLRQLQAVGVDFVIVSTQDSPGLMRLEDIGKVMVIDHTLDHDLVRTINELDVDAVAIAQPRPEGNGGHLSIRDVMRLKLLRMLVRKPMIVLGDGSVNPQDVEVLRDVGVEGIVIDLSATGEGERSIEETVRSYAEAIAKLGPAARKRQAKSSAIIPSIRRETSPSKEETDEPDEF